MIIYFRYVEGIQVFGHIFWVKMHNKRYIPIDYGFARATLIHSLFPPNKSTLGARLFTNFATLNREESAPA